ncbi:MAG: ATP-binding protein [Thermodesulfobacteriota bacterium]
MHPNQPSAKPPPLPVEERRKRRRETLLIFLTILLIVALTYAQTRIIRFGSAIPVSSAVLMFVVLNVNLVLLTALFFLVTRNLVKLWYERRRKVPGSRLRVRLSFAFVSLSIVPTFVLFMFSLNFAVASMEFWFNVPVEQAFKSSLSVGKKFYQRIEDNQHFYLERIAYQVNERRLMEPENTRALRHYIRVTQRAFNLDAVEVYFRDGSLAYSALDDTLVDQDILHRLTFPELTKEPAPAVGVITVVNTTPAGELVRTIASIPFDATRASAKGFVVVDTLLSPDMSQAVSSVNRGYEEYRQHLMLKEPIKVSLYVMLSIVALVIVFCSIWFGVYLAKSLTGPIAELAEGFRRVSSGELSVTLHRGSDDEMGSLVESFNRMTRELLASREQLTYSASMLSEQNVEIEKRRRYMEVVLRNVSSGVISLDWSGLVSTINKSAERMLGVEAADVLGKSYKSLLKGRNARLSEEVMEEFVRGQEGSMQLPIKQTIEGRARSLMVTVTALRDDKGRHMGTVIAFDDLTDLERAQRMAAWREVARRVAHEVKNPLTPIRLSAQRLLRKFGPHIEDPVFAECAKTIIEQVDAIQNLVNEFSAYARFPAPRPVSCSLPVLVADAVAPYKEGYPDISFSVSVENEESLPRLLLDPAQIKRALINLLDNAIAALNGKGEIAVGIRHAQEEGRVILTVSDSGKGIPDADKARLFEPYFSTKKAGTGLGLSIVATIITEHRGSIRVEDNTPSGARFVIEFPAS